MQEPEPDPIPDTRNSIDQPETRQGIFLPDLRVKDVMLAYLLVQVHHDWGQTPGIYRESWESFASRLHLIRGRATPGVHPCRVRSQRMAILEWTQAGRRLPIPIIV